MPTESLPRGALVVKLALLFSSFAFVVDEWVSRNGTRFSLEISVGDSGHEQGQP
jgi:hypothetical protein